MGNREIIRFIKYFVYVAFIIIVMALINRYMIYSKEKATENWFLYLVTSIPVLIGILAGIPSFMVTYKIKGTWYIDWVKVIAITLPALMILSLPHLYYSPLGKHLPSSILNVIWSETSNVISGFIFGFTLLSFPEKRN